MPELSFDTGCYELAKRFLEDSRSDPPESEINELAVEVQRAIESYLESRGYA